MSDIKLLKEKNKSLSGADLKRIALISMTLDHFGAIVIEPFLGLGSTISWFGSPVFGIDILYYALRLIGRIAFMLYAFVLVEGFVHTRHRLLYLGRLFIFALLSQPFFSYALVGTWWSWSTLNIFFTLSLGLCLLMVIEYLKNQESWLIWLTVLGFAGVAFVLNMDWHWLGILMIFVIYYFRDQTTIRTLALVVLGAFQMTAPLAVLIIDRYNGKRGRVVKYFHYLYYPLHLWIFALIAQSLR